ncbi:MAG: shikimate kinase [Bacteroidota bacterium]
MGKIVLLGYMCSGKSSVGRALAQQLDCTFIDLDDAIVEDTGLTIPELFAQKGELFFRKKETAVLQAILQQSENLVLALGGGTPCYGNNMDLVNDGDTQSVYLQFPVGTLAARIANEKAKRPLVARIPEEQLPEFVGKHLFERAAFYQKAKHTLDADGQSVDELVLNLVSLLT